MFSFQRECDEGVYDSVYNTSKVVCEKCWQLDAEVLSTGSKRFFRFCV